MYSLRPVRIVTNFSSCLRLLNDLFETQDRAMVDTVILKRGKQCISPVYLPSYTANAHNELYAFNPVKVTH